MDKISISIVNWNGRKLLSECLNRLRQQSYQQFSVILVDNGSNYGSVDFVSRNYSEIKTVSLPKNGGFAAANNIALKTVQTEYVALLNNDAVPYSFWLEYLVAALECYPEAGFAVSKMLFHDNSRTTDRAGDAYTATGVGCLRGRAGPGSSYNKRE